MPFILFKCKWFNSLCVVQWNLYTHRLKPLLKLIFLLWLINSSRQTLSIFKLSVTFSVFNQKPISSIKSNKQVSPSFLAVIRISDFLIWFLSKWLFVLVKLHIGIKSGLWNWHVYTYICIYVSARPFGTYTLFPYIYNCAKISWNEVTSVHTCICSYMYISELLILIKWPKNGRWQKLTSIIQRALLRKSDMWILKQWWDTIRIYRLVWIWLLCFFLDFFFW